MRYRFVRRGRHAVLEVSTNGPVINSTHLRWRPATDREATKLLELALAGYKAGRK